MDSNQHEPNGKPASATVAPRKTAASIASELRISRRSLFYASEFSAAVDLLAATTGENLQSKVMAGKSGLTMKAIRAIAKMPPSLHKELIAEARANRGRLLPRQYRDLDRAIESTRVAVNDLARRWPVEKCNGCTLPKTLRYFANVIEEQEATR